MAISNVNCPLAGIFTLEIVMRPGPEGALTDDIGDFRKKLPDVLNNYATSQSRNFIYGCKQTENSDRG